MTPSGWWWFLHCHLLRPSIKASLNSFMGSVIYQSTPASWVCLLLLSSHFSCWYSQLRLVILPRHVQSMGVPPQPWWPWGSIHFQKHLISSEITIESPLNHHSTTIKPPLKHHSTTFCCWWTHQSHWALPSTRTTRNTRTWPPPRCRPAPSKPPALQAFEGFYGDLIWFTLW